jgi:preprotein translocase SecE subunit
VEQTVAEEKPKAKRRVKNPETFRERALKASETGVQPKRVTRVKGKFGQFIAWFFRPVWLALKWMFDHPPLRWLARPARLVGKVIFPAYFRNSWQELRQVTWPSWKQSRQLTFAVLIFAVIFGGAVALVDYGLDKAFQHLLLK